MVKGGEGVAYTNNDLTCVVFAEQLHSHHSENEDNNTQNKG